MVEYIGIDMGGTNIKVGAIDRNEKLIFEYKEPTFKDVKYADDLYEKIVNLIKMVPDFNRAKAIGVGIPGSIDLKTGKLTTLRNISMLKDYPFREKLADEFDAPIYFENDARIAALAEALKGKGRGKKIVCYITISTGLGGGVVINNQIYTGSSNLGGYFSRVILDGEDTSDSLISSSALCRQAREKISENIKSTQELFELEEKGNIEAKQIVDKFKKNLVVLLLNISSIINPDIIIIGGGVINAKDRFLQDVINDFRIKAHPLVKDTIIDTVLFEEPGILGAALLAKEKYINEKM